MHPLFVLLATRPQLLLDHAQAYSALFTEEFGQARASWRHRAVLQAVALCCLGVAAVLAGVALMLWAVNPELSVRAAWVLWATPLLPLLIAATCIASARRQASHQVFSNLSQQISADVALLRSASPP